jgi:tRNA-dihydrouridine synthase
MPVIRRHLELAVLYLPSRQALVRMKNHIARYLREIPGATALRKKMMATRSLDELAACLTEVS